MTSATRNARALRAAPILVLAFLMAGGGAAPAPKSTPRFPNADAAQMLGGVTAAPALRTPRPTADAPSLPSLPQSVGRQPHRRVAGVVADVNAAGARPAARIEARTKARAEAKADARVAAPVYAGTNHFWIPSLGLSYPVHAFPCSRSRPPDDYIYRWGCAGENNVYILGHAHSVMKPLHDLYVSGGLRKGMTAVYADHDGKVTTYRVTAWQVVDPTQVEWAIASLPVPSMTLQTCVGKRSQWRLNVRLVAVS